MDLMLLVVDATKGMQAQTTECVVIGEAVMASGADVIVVLNKVHTYVRAGAYKYGPFATAVSTHSFLLAVLREIKGGWSTPSTMSGVDGS